MTEPDDHQLLVEFARENSEAAFAALVSRHINLVYSTALRSAGSTHAADEITQAVFIILARKADHLSRKIVLSGWLYQTARLTAANFLRTEIRRQKREQEAYMQSTLESGGDASSPSIREETWNQIAPLLDDAISKLGEKDRNAVVLRFFENKNLHEVGAALGASEDAAKMRLSRALEKLRKIFTKRGVISTTAILAGAISAKSVQAAPAILAKTVTAVAIAKGVAASGSTLTLIKGALKIMAWTKMKTAIIASVVVLLAAGTTTVTVKEIQKHKTYSWEVPRPSFDVLYKTPPQVVIVPTKFSEEDGGGVGSNDRVLGIAQPFEAIVQAAYMKDRFRTVIASELPQGRYDYIANLPDGAGSGKALQEEIRRKFDIVGRPEQRVTDVLVLKVANSHADGIKPANSLRQSMHQPNMGSMSGFGRFAVFDQPISSLVPFLESRFRIPVIDQTGLSKHYDFNLTWDEKDRDHINSAGLQQSLLDQLGLELVPGREPIEMLVVEKVK